LSPVRDDVIDGTLARLARGERDRGERRRGVGVHDTRSKAEAAVGVLMPLQPRDGRLVPERDGGERGRLGLGGGSRARAERLTGPRARQGVREQAVQVLHAFVIGLLPMDLSPPEPAY
jgi:hypothetical protein